MKSFLLLLFFSASTSNSMGLTSPNSKVIDKLSQGIFEFSKIESVINPTDKIFLNNRVNDMVYHNNYYKSYDNSKFNSLIVCAIASIPLFVYMFKAVRTTVNKDLQSYDELKSNLITEAQREKTKAKEDEEHKEEKENSDSSASSSSSSAAKKLADLPAERSIVIYAIWKVLTESVIDLLSDPLSVKSAITVMSGSAAFAYYYKLYRDYSGSKFYGINSILELLLESYKEKSAIVTNKTLSHAVALQKIGILDDQIRQIINKYKLDSSLRKKLVSFLEMTVNFIKA